MWRDHTYLGPTPKIRYVPDKDLTFPDSNPLFPDKDFRFSSSQIRYFPDRDIWELLGASARVARCLPHSATYIPIIVSQSSNWLLAASALRSSLLLDDELNHFIKY